MLLTGANVYFFFFFLITQERCGEILQSIKHILQMPINLRLASS
jgi:hypothetical protein